MYTHIILYVHENNMNYYYYFISIVYILLCLVCRAEPHIQTHTEQLWRVTYIYIYLDGFCWLLVGISSDIPCSIKHNFKETTTPAVWRLLRDLDGNNFILLHSPEKHKLKSLLHRHCTIGTSPVYRLYRRLLLTTGFFIYNNAVYDYF